MANKAIAAIGYRVLPRQRRHRYPLRRERRVGGTMTRGKRALSHRTRRLSSPGAVTGEDVVFRATRGRTGAVNGGRVGRAQSDAAGGVPRRRRVGRALSALTARHNII